MQFGVHTGLQNTTTDELPGAVAPHRGPRLRVDLDLGPLLRGRRHGHPDGTTTSGYDCLEAVATHAALALDDDRACGAAASCTASGTGIRPCSPTSIATLDQLSDGRITLGLGAGWHQGEFAAYGMPFPPVGVRLRKLDEAIQCVRLLLTEDVADFDGEFFTAARRALRSEARAGPAAAVDRRRRREGDAAHRGAARRRLERRRSSRPTTYRAQGRRCSTSTASESGRDPATIEKSVNLTLAWTRRGARASSSAACADYIGRARSPAARRQMVDRIGEYRDAGADWVIVALRAPFDVDGLDRFAAEVLPAVRADAGRVARRTSWRPRPRRERARRGRTRRNAAGALPSTA